MSDDRAKEISNRPLPEGQNALAPSLTTKDSTKAMDNLWGKRREIAREITLAHAKNPAFIMLFLNEILEGVSFEIVAGSADNILTLIKTDTGDGRWDAPSADAVLDLVPGRAQREMTIETFSYFVVGLLKSKAGRAMQKKYISQEFRTRGYYTRSKQPITTHLNTMKGLKLVTWPTGKHDAVIELTDSGGEYFDLLTGSSKKSLTTDQRLELQEAGLWLGDPL